MDAVGPRSSESLVTRHNQAQAPQDRYPRMVQLTDGTPVRLRPLGSQDKRVLKVVMARLSEESRYRRFMAPVRELSPQMLRYFTEFNHADHFALGACVLDQGAPSGIGVARYIRFPKQPHVAEPAFAIADAYQARGLGRLMLEQIMLEAHEHGITQFHATLFRDNSPMRQLFADYGATFQSDGLGVETAEFAVRGADQVAGPPDEADVNRSTRGR